MIGYITSIRSLVHALVRRTHAKIFNFIDVFFVTWTSKGPKQKTTLTNLIDILLK